MSNYEIISLVLNALVAVAGFSAIVIYLHQRHVQKKTAATLILKQIDEVESVIVPLKEYYNKHQQIDDTEIYLVEEVPYNGAWQKYENLFIKSLNTTDLKLLHNFFTSAYRIEKARLDFNAYYHMIWNGKSIMWQYYEGQKLNSEELTESQIADLYNKCGAFSPSLIQTTMKNALASFDTLSGKTAYDKLYKKSYLKQ